MFALIQFIDNDVLDFFDTHSPCQGFNPALHTSDDEIDQGVRKPVLFRNFIIGGLDRPVYFSVIVWDFAAVPLDDLHVSSSIRFRASPSSSSQV